MYQVFIDEIEKANKISIFRHIHPDGDAVGSQLACYYWIKENFKDKEVHIAGFDKFDIFPFTEEVSDDFIKNSLAFSFDTSTLERCDDKRITTAKKIIRVDHHPVVEHFEDILIAEDFRSSACELLCEILIEAEKEGYIFSSKVAYYLYSGLLTDTLNFKTTNTKARTLEIGAYLARKGVEISDLSVKMFSTDAETFKMRSKLRNYVQYNDGLALVILNQNDLDNINTDCFKAKNCVSELGEVNEFKIWGILAYDKEKGTYEGSLRSKKEYVVNTIASHFNGGGHKQAAGIRGLTLSDIETLKKELLAEINNINV